MNNSDGKFKWTKLEAQAYTNLLFLFALQVKNHIHDPAKPLILYADTSQLETGLSAFQFDTDELSLKLISTKSILLPTAVRRQSPGQGRARPGETSQGSAAPAAARALAALGTASPTS